MFVVKGWGAGLKNAGLPKKNKERVQDFDNLSHSWVDYHHLPEPLFGLYLNNSSSSSITSSMAFGDALFTYQFVILIVSSITDAYLTISF